jgi:hypothetical protein
MGGAQGRSWTEDETERFRSHMLRGGSAARASVMFRRTVNGVRKQAVKMGLPFPNAVQLRKRLADSAGIAAPSIRSLPAPPLIVFPLELPARKSPNEEPT